MLGSPSRRAARCCSGVLKLKTNISVVGARPQFVKAAAVTRAILRSGLFEDRILHTGQHFDDNMSGVFFRELEIPEPTFKLQISGGGHGQMTGRMLEGIEQILMRERPDSVTVYGDTNSTLAGALAAVKLGIPVVHIEAGLRSFNMRMPEEINRILTDRISSLLLAPTSAAIEHLAAEGLTAGAMHVGDVMFDATLFARRKAETCSTILQDLELRPDGFLLATVHRAENTADEGSLRRVMAYLERAAASQPVILPVHPRTRALISAHDIRPKGIRLIDPVGYFDMHALLAGAAAVYTDSGGLQKEAYFHRKPCVTLRDETEWTETITHGWNRLWTTDTYAPRSDIGEYGHGHAAEAVVAAIADFMSGRSR